MDVVMTPPDGSVISNEEGLDENNLLECEETLPDAIGEIGVHHSITEPDTLSPHAGAKMRKVKILKWHN